MADDLARAGSSKTPIGPGPLLPLSKGWAKGKVSDWSRKEHVMHWSGLRNCRQSKEFLREPLKEADSRKLLELKRPILRKLIGVITGHFYFNQHLSNMRLVNDPVCIRCHEDRDTAYHLVCLCPRLANRRNRILGDFVLSQNQLPKISVWDLLRFIRDIPIDMPTVT